MSISRSDPSPAGQAEAEISPATASRAGRHARDRGDPAEANPYPPGSDAHRLWRRAWETPDDESNSAG
ncbi:ribosome modulation factor [Methylobacterium nigriterrae]|uniref:ribosome modulation factor n=1 Tax=Methylobacterium nigriterrae TaxID=3127512 RepID=UPI0030137DBB